MSRPDWTEWAQLTFPLSAFRTQTLPRLPRRRRRHWPVACPTHQAAQLPQRQCPRLLRAAAPALVCLPHARLSRASAPRFSRLFRASAAARSASAQRRQHSKRAFVECLQLLEKVTFKNPAARAPCRRPACPRRQSVTRASPLRALAGRLGWVAHARGLALTAALVPALARARVYVYVYVRVCCGGAGT